MKPTPFQQALTQAALGNIDPTQLESLNTVASTGKLGPVCPVLDSDGNPLDMDAVYRHRDQLIKITEWRFGGGNFMDTYYWVWFLQSSDMKPGRVTVDAKYLPGMAGRTYQAPFEKVED